MIFSRTSEIHRHGKRVYVMCYQKGRFCGLLICRNMAVALGKRRSWSMGDLALTDLEAVS